MPHVIVVGNEKGGSGKSTTAMHVIVALMAAGGSVGSVDLDGRQQTLTRYIGNRRAFCEAKSLKLPIPAHRVVERSELPAQSEARADEGQRFQAALTAVGSNADFVVIDAPGSDTWLSRLGHACADTLITPLNDSFIDLDLLATVDSDTFEVIRPSLYSEMVWEARKCRAMTDRGSIDWVVMRNRLATLDAKNKQRVAGVLNKLARRIGFRLAPGFGERVIFRELFLSGLTLLDLKEPGAGVDISMSHVAARNEVRALLAALKLPQVDALRAAG